MRTLFITNSYLDGNGGGIYASRTHINLFAELSDSMTLIYPYQKGKDARYILEEKIKMVPVEDNRSLIRKFAELCFGRVHRFDLDNRYINSDKYDVVVFDSSVTSSGLIMKFKKAGFKTITIHHNYQIQYLLGDGSRLTLLPNLFWTWIYEGQAVRHSDLNLTLTQQDVELLRGHYGGEAPFDVLGVFEYKASQPEEIPIEERGHRYVITGGLGSKQTEDSISRWLNDYYPLLRENDHLARLTIAGSNPSAKLKEVITSNGISLIENPIDMAPILLDADYYLNPVDCGGGLKLRNLDGLKFGLPVLTHRVSLRGYEKMMGRGVVFSYENPSEFINGINHLKKMQLDRRSIQQLYLQQYNYKEGIKQLMSILTDKGLI